MARHAAWINEPYDDDKFDRLWESPPIPVIPSNPAVAATTTVTSWLRVDAHGGTATVFVGNGDDPQLSPDGARALAAALTGAADVADELPPLGEDSGLGR